MRRSKGDWVAESGGVGNGVGEGAVREPESRRFACCIYVLGPERERESERLLGRVEREKMARAFVGLRLVATSLSFSRDR